MSSAQVSNHPVLAHKLTKLRNKTTPPKVFRELLKEITFYLGYESTSTLAVRDVEIETPVAAHTGQHIAEKVALIPILRSGLGMVDPMLQLLPNASVHHIGIYRDKASLVPIVYYHKLPPQCTADVAIILEPCIVTAGTLSATVGILKDWGVKKVVVMSVLATTLGLSNLNAKHPDVVVHCAAVDDEIKDGFICPGFGDTGDRQFNTFEAAEADPAVAAAGAKRPRTEESESKQE